MASLRESLTYDPAELAFGTSGLRGLVSDMTDLECYINTAGFLRFVEGAEGAVSTVFLAGDLRGSTPRIARAVACAIQNSGAAVQWCEFIPTPALALAAQDAQTAGIMVTGSHIPDDRNGIKFYKPSGEVLKADEAAIKRHVAAVRQELYSQSAKDSLFDADGALLTSPELSDPDETVAERFVERFAAFFKPDCLSGCTVVVYQHSAVGRDLLVEILQRLGATVKPVGRSEKFIPIDSENVTTKDREFFSQLAAEYPDNFAIVSTDGDSDRPFVIDETGVFHRGDELGAVVAEWVGADYAAIPVSSNDAVADFLTQRQVKFDLTKIGSPYVIVAMQAAAAKGSKVVASWEVNGGFLLGVDITKDGRTISQLPTRDAFFPIMVALVAARQAGLSVSKLFARLPQRFTQAGMIDNFPVEVSAKILSALANDTAEARQRLAEFFTKEAGFGSVSSINSLDGIRISFDNGDIAHIRPSGNAPQLRIYSVADTQQRADEIVDLGLQEPTGILRQLAASF